jgi:hypothetical protein
VTAGLLTTPLRVFLSGSILAVVGAWVVAHWPISPAAAVVALRDGDLERDERLALLQCIFAAANDQLPGNDPGLLRAMAAIALEDEPGYRKWCGGRPLPFVAAPAADRIEEVALGDPVLGALLRAMVRESVADRDGARLAYSQVERSSMLFRMPLAQRLAAEGRERIR